MLGGGGGRGAGGAGYSTADPDQNMRARLGFTLPAATAVNSLDYEDLWFSRKLLWRWKADQIHPGAGRGGGGARHTRPEPTSCQHSLKCCLNPHRRPRVTFTISSSSGCVAGASNLSCFSIPEVFFFRNCDKSRECAQRVGWGAAWGLHHSHMSPKCNVLIDLASGSFSQAFPNGSDLSL